MRRGVLTLYAILIVLAATFWFLLDHWSSKGPLS